MNLLKTDPVVIRGVTLTDAQTDRFLAHSREALNGQAWGDKKMQAAGKRGLMKLNAEIEAMAAAAQADLDLSETLAIRHRMGAEVEADKHTGRIVAGLALAYKKGVLNGAAIPAHRLLETGIDYGKAFVTATGLTTPSRNEVRGSGGNSAQEVIAAAGLALKAFRSNLTSIQRLTLDSVCGRDLTVNETAVSMRSNYRTVEKALRKGLCAASKK